MHSPSLITPIVANAVLGDHARDARRHRSSRTPRTSGPIGRLRARRSDASRAVVPRGRPLPRAAR